MRQRLPDYMDIAEGYYAALARPVAAGELRSRDWVGLDDARQEEQSNDSASGGRANARQRLSVRILHTFLQGFSTAQ
jgi:hypothetical protein